MIKSITFKKIFKGNIMHQNFVPVTVSVQGNALNTLFSKILLVLLCILPISLFYSYFSNSHSQSFIFYASLGLQAIISACMGFSYVVSVVLAKQRLDYLKKHDKNPFFNSLKFLLDIYQSILPVSIAGKEKICYEISFISYVSSAFVLSFEISIMALSFFLIALSQLHMLITAIFLSAYNKKNSKKD